MTRPNTDLSIIVTDAAGNTKTLSSEARVPGDIPKGVTFGTQQGSGFYTASFTIACPIDDERVDLHLRDDVRIVGSGGDTAYEGFIVDMPRSTDGEGEGTITVTCAGYMADTARASFRMVFVDRDLSAWGPVSTSRRVSLISLGFGQVAETSVTPDRSGRQTLRTAFTGTWTGGAKPISEAWYDAGPNTSLGRITASWTRGQNVAAGDPSWAYASALATDDQALFADSSGSLLAVGPGGFTLSASTNTRRFATLELHYSGSPGGLDGVEYAVDWSDVAVYGNHGLPLLTTNGSAPYSVAASDVIRYLVAAYCPKLNTRGVEDTTYPIGHLAFKDRTKVYDALLKVNSYHLWALAVWEDRTLYFKQIDLGDWDWEVRHDVRGTTIGLQGDSVENLRNGIIVQYQDVSTGTTEELHPSDYDELLDASLDNPFNQHGDEAYGDPYVIPFPTTAANALELGRIKLAEDLQVKAPGSFTVTGSIFDRAGVEQPVWRVRCGDRVRLTSTANLSDRPRLIGETSYTHDGRTVTISVDSTSGMIDALFDRTTTALQAAGLS